MPARSAAPLPIAQAVRLVTRAQVSHAKVVLRRARRIQVAKDRVIDRLVHLGPRRHRVSGGDRVCAQALVRAVRAYLALVPGVSPRVRDLWWGRNWWRRGRA